MLSLFGALHYSRFHGHLCAGAEKRFVCDIFRDAIDFKKNPPRTHREYIMTDRALAAAHGHFRRPLGNRFIWKNANPNLTAFLHIAGHRFSGGFNLARCYPRASFRLEAKTAERKRNAANFNSAFSRSPLLPFSILYFLWD